MKRQEVLDHFEWRITPTGGGPWVRLAWTKPIGGEMCTEKTCDHVPASTGLTLEELLGPHDGPHEAEADYFTACGFDHRMGIV